MAKPRRSPEETIARNTTVLTWALVWIPLAVAAVALAIWGVTAVVDHTAEAKRVAAAQTQATADAAYDQAKAAQIQPVRDALRQAGYDPTTSRAGYGTVQNFVEAQCQYFRAGLTVDQEAQGLAGSAPMPVDSARQISNTIISSGACS